MAGLVKQFSKEIARFIGLWSYGYLSQIVLNLTLFPGMGSLGPVERSVAATLAPFYSVFSATTWAALALAFSGPGKGSNYVQWILPAFFLPATTFLIRVSSAGSYGIVRGYPADMASHTIESWSIGFFWPVLPTLIALASPALAHRSSPISAVGWPYSGSRTVWIGIPIIVIFVSSILLGSMDREAKLSGAIQETGEIVLVHFAGLRKTTLAMTRLDPIKSNCMPECEDPLKAAGDDKCVFLIRSTDGREFALPQAISHPEEYGRIAGLLESLGRKVERDGCLVDEPPAHKPGPFWIRRY